MPFPAYLVTDFEVLKGMEGNRNAPIEIDRKEFQKLGYQLVDRIADFIDSIKDRPVTTTKSQSELLKVLGDNSLPENGIPPGELLSRTSDLLFNYSLLNGHPRFLGYITSSAAPLGALADLLAASVNPNVGANILSPMATEMEKQTIKWLAEFIGVSPSYGGILVSGGNMANFTAFLAARTAKAPITIKEEGISNTTDKLTIYCSKTTHTWVEKAAILFGSGSKSIRWIKTTASNQIDERILEETINEDLENGCRPIMVIGTAGDVSTGAVDNLKNLAAISKQYNMWFHIDGAYGIPAAVIPSLKNLFNGVTEADSIALDPHKWLYSPLEAGCTLVKDPQHLLNTFSSHPEYYNFSTTEGETSRNYYEFGLQNSRGFRALKVWMTLQQVGRSGYEKLISEDIEFAELLFALAAEHEELEAVTQNLSISTLRYIPIDYDSDLENEYLNELNVEILNVLQSEGEVFLSNAVVHGKYCLRACVVNFRTSKHDIEEIIQIIVRVGRRVHLELSVS